MTSCSVLLVTDDRRTICGELGRASIVAVATVERGRVRAWEVHAVSWREDHDADPRGADQEAILHFVRRHEVSAVVADRVSAPMRAQLGQLGVAVFVHGGIDAEAAALAAATVLNDRPRPGPARPRR